MAGNYEKLDKVFQDAMAQASTGKGNERHATDEPFEEQLSPRLTKQFGLGYPMGQAMKKCDEAKRMLDKGVWKNERARAEILGAINYLAIACIALDDA